jgi:hypothetical protein
LTTRLTTLSAVQVLISRLVADGIVEVRGEGGVVEIVTLGAFKLREYAVQRVLKE